MATKQNTQNKNDEKGSVNVTCSWSTTIIGKPICLVQEFITAAIGFPLACSKHSHKSSGMKKERTSHPLFLTTQQLTKHNNNTAARSHAHNTPAKYYAVSELQCNTLCNYYSWIRLWATGQCLITSLWIHFPIYTEHKSEWMANLYCKNIICNTVLKCINFESIIRYRQKSSSN